MECELLRNTPQFSISAFGQYKAPYTHYKALYTLCYLSKKNIWTSIRHFQPSSSSQESTNKSAMIKAPVGRKKVGDISITFSDIFWRRIFRLIHEIGDIFFTTHRYHLSDFSMKSMRFRHSDSDEMALSSSNTLYESKYFSFDGQQEFTSQDSFGRVEGDIQSGDTGVGGGQLVVVRRFHCNRWHWLKSFRTGWHGW